MSAELEQIWSHVQAELAAAVDESTYRIWLEPLRPRELAEGRLLIEVPQRGRAWISDRFGRVLQTCVSAVLGPEVTVDLITAGGGPSASPSPAASPSRRPASGPAGVPPLRSPQLNPKLTFDQFVIGDSNRLAHAAALAVAEMPAQAYNPLFICGPPGLGKTHLLHAIAAYLLAHGGGLTVRYTTSEGFTNEFLAALQSGSVESFKVRFRHVDVLLVDDVQFLERKAHTEEEFFHTFNALLDVGAQLVLTSDRIPQNMPALEARLRERFQSGLVADVRPPDLSTRLTILRKRAHHDGVAVDPSTLNLIAERVTANVRALEGALIRTVAFASLTNRPLTPELAQELLDGLYPATTSRRTRSIADIQAVACDEFGISAQELLSSTRTARLTWPRQVAMYLSRELTDESLPEIGRRFGGRDHTTVLHACRRTSQRMAADATARQVVTDLLERLRSAPPGRSS